MKIVTVAIDTAIDIGSLIRKSFVREQSFDCLPQATEKRIDGDLFCRNIGNRGEAGHSGPTFFLPHILQSSDEGADLFHHHIVN